jgi:putative endonuclease
MSVSVYVLWSEELEKRYVGCSRDVHERLTQHNKGRSKFTARGAPWKLLYEENYTTNLEARRRELFLKSGAGRVFLSRTLEGHSGYPECELPENCLGHTI